MEESREERRLKQEKKFAIRDFKEVIKTGNIWENWNYFIYNIIFCILPNRVAYGKWEYKEMSNN